MEKPRDGRSPETAFIISDSSGEMTVSIGNVVENLFGGCDGDYFVLSETTMEQKETGKRFKILYVQDCRNTNHKVFFEIG